jgi:hypothetical protein
MPFFGCRTGGAIQQAVAGLVHEDRHKENGLNNQRATGIRTASMLAICIAAAGCSSFSPDAGHEIVLIDKPIFFGHGGVESEPVKTGRTFGALTTDGVDVYMQPQRFDAELADTMTSDGVPVS